MLISFITAVVPILIIAGIGFVISRRTDLLSHPGLGKLTLNLALPALILHSMLEMRVSLFNVAHLVLVTGACVLVGALIVFIFCRIRGRSSRFYLTTLVNPNTGNFGIPMIFALLGPEALATAVIVSAAITLSHVTLGITVMTGRIDTRVLATNTPLMALVLGAVLGGSDLEMPLMLSRVIEMLSGIAQPMLLLLLGHSLAQIRIGSARELGVLAGFSLFRPISGALIALLVVQFAGLTPWDSLILIMQMSMPVAMMSYLLSLRYEGPTERIAALTFTSIPVTLAVLALIFAYQQQIMSLL